MTSLEFTTFSVGVHGSCGSGRTLCAADAAPPRAAGPLYAPFGASRLQLCGVFPNRSDGERYAGGGETARELRRRPPRVLIQSEGEVLAGAGVMLRVLQWGVKVQQVDIRHTHTVAVANSIRVRARTRRCTGTSVRYDVVAPP